LFKLFGSSGCRLKDIRYVESEELLEPVDGGMWEVFYYYVDDSGNTTQFDDSHTAEQPPRDDYYCTSCNTGLAWWADVVEHVSDFDDDDDGDSLTWKWSFGV
jgi:hypothetical protein